MLLPAAATAQDDGAAQLEFFEREIRPIIHNNCYECHSVQAGKQKGGLLLDSKWGWETGGDSGPAIIPGNLDASLLIDAVRRTETTVDAMPPKSILSSDAISKLEQWVKMGAPDPRPKVESEVALVEEFDLKGRFEEHWCWRPVQSPEPPAVQQADWPSHPIDNFVLARVEAAGLVPAEPADQRTWLRRVYFDLIGLPPTPEQIAEFLEQGSKEQVVDELLASPHFGEKWARHMLDLVRYAETCGHEFDYPIPHAHRYRDYVIRALNADVPYDDFIREHVAGDLLQQPRLHPDTHTNESIIGTGFWYLHEATHAPTDVRQDEADHLNSQIDVFTKTFQALTVACARCHDHKFDAISTADYYALTAYIKGSCRTEFPLDPHAQTALANAHLQELRVQATEGLRQISSDAIGPGASLLAAIELIRDEQANRRDRDPWAGELFEDFDSGYDGWTIEGGAFGDAPAAGAFDGQGELAGFRGNGLVNTWNGDDKLEGEATSAAFEITRPFINFLIGGGAHERTVFELRIGNQVVDSKSGRNAESLEPATFDVTEHIGKTGVFRIRDRQQGSWGHLNLDHIVFSDTAVVNETIPRHSAESVASAARARGIPEAHLNSWIEILTAEPDKDADPLQKFFTGWMGQPGALAQRQRQVRSTRKQLAEFRNKSELFADFGHGQVP